MPNNIPPQEKKKNAMSELSIKYSDVINYCIPLELLPTNLPQIYVRDIERNSESIEFWRSSLPMSYKLLSNGQTPVVTYHPHVKSLLPRSL